MIRKLRIKLVAVSMASLIAVLGVIAAAANISGWMNIIKDADAILDLLAENGGVFPERMLDPGIRDNDVDGQFGSEFAESGGYPQPYEPPEPNDKKLWDGRRRRGGMFSQETAFETRYFYVCLDSGGAVASVNTANIAAVSQEKAGEYAVSVFSGGAERGFCDAYRFISVPDGDGRRIVFLDRTREIETFRSFLTSSILISAAGLAAVFLLITLLSARIVRPISDSYEKQRRFITDAGHEIRTPITIIDADADVISMDVGEDNEWVADIKKQTKRLADLTSELINLAKMEEGAPASKMIEFPVSDIADECARSFSGLAKAQGKSFDIDIAPSLTMKGDERNITQMINNLLDNAMKYSPEGGRTGIKLSRAGRSIRLEVYNDAGIMPEEDIKHIFDRFYRADKSRSSKSGGFGIGLSAAKAVADSHRGKISASQDENGVFRVTAVFPQ